MAAESLELLNLTLYNIGGSKFDKPFASLTLLKRKRYRGVTIEGSGPKPKNKTQERELLEYWMKLFNDSFEVLGLESTASIGVSDGTDWMWKKGDKGIVIETAERDTKNDIGFMVSKSRNGCNRIDFFARNEKKYAEIAECVFKQLVNSESFKKKQGKYTLYGKAFDIIQTIHEFPIPVKVISNVISQEIQGNQSILNAMISILDFKGNITLMRPYSFQNSLSDILTLNLEGKLLYIGLSAGMTSDTAIKKFKKMLFEKLNEEVSFVDAL